MNAASTAIFDDNGLREELLMDNGGDMRTGLLTNTERVERTGKNLSEGLRVAYETEEVSGQILGDLDQQRETLQRSRNRVSDLRLLLQDTLCQCVEFIFFLCSSINFHI